MRRGERQVALGNLELGGQLVVRRKLLRLCVLKQKVSVWIELGEVAWLNAPCLRPR